MAGNDVKNYIDGLKVKEEKELDLYSIREELLDLSKSSHIFDSFEKEAMHVSKEHIEQIDDLGLLMRMRNLASQINHKKRINDKLHTLHFNLNILKNAADVSAVKAALNVFLYSDETNISSMVGELNDFKAKLEEFKTYHSRLLPKGLDIKIEMEEKYKNHIEKLHSVHQRQKNAFISLTRLFLKMTKSHMKNLQKFKNKS